MMRVSSIFFTALPHMMESRRKAVLLVGVVCVAGTGIAAFVFWAGGDMRTEGDGTPSSAAVISSKEEPLPISSLRGEACPPSQNASAGGSTKSAFGQTKSTGQSADGSRRPFAVMLAEDARARPLSGIGAADVVIEMPVLKGGTNRFMAVFQCTIPSEIGSVRSARHDFIPLAAGFDAIYVHWGGSHYALDELKTRIIDDIDALPNPYGAFWRKHSLPAPHNGFTSQENLIRAAEGLGYRVHETFFAGYPRKEKEPSKNAGTLPNGVPTGTLRIDYPSTVLYAYDPGKGTYARWRGGLKEIDALSQRQVEADAVIVIEAASRQIEPDYNDVDIEGGGTAHIFQDGMHQIGTWKKDSQNHAGKLMFLDENDNEIPLVPGSLWIQVADPGTEVRWQQK